MLDILSYTESDSVRKYSAFFSLSKKARAGSFSKSHESVIEKDFYYRLAQGNVRRTRGDPPG